MWHNFIRIPLWRRILNLFCSRETDLHYVFERNQEFVRHPQVWDMWYLPTRTWCIWRGEASSGGRPNQHSCTYALSPMRPLWIEIQRELLFPKTHKRETLLLSMCLSMWNEIHRWNFSRNTQNRETLSSMQPLWKGIRRGKVPQNTPLCHQNWNWIY